MSAIPQDTPAAVRERILAAAHERFRTFGFGKTTMAEIAEAAGMSAANLYRYFESKLDLGAECCGRAMQERVERLRAAAHAKGLSAAERLERFYLENIEYTHELAGEEPRLNEMVENMTGKRPELVREKLRVVESLIAEILAHGNETGEFAVDDVLAAARDLHATMAVFEVPIFVGLYPKEVFIERARGVAAMLVRGLAPRPEPGE